jgi:hypothetical protein
MRAKYSNNIMNYKNSYLIYKQEFIKKTINKVIVITPEGVSDLFTEKH